MNLNDNKAFLLIETRVGRAKEAISALKQLEGVKSADTVTGSYDVIAVLEGESLAAIGDLVTSKINPIPSYTLYFQVCYHHLPRLD